MPYFQPESIENEYRVYSRDPFSVAFNNWERVCLSCQSTLRRHTVRYGDFIGPYTREVRLLCSRPQRSPRVVNNYNDPL